MSFNKRLYSRNFFIANLVILGIVIGFGLAFLFRTPSNTQNNPLPVVKAETPSAQANPETAQSIATAESVQHALRSIAKNVLPAVVELDVVEGGTQGNQDNQQNSFPILFLFWPRYSITGSISAARRLRLRCDRASIW